MSGTVRLREVEDGDLAIFFEHQADPISSLMAAFPSRERGPFEEVWGRIRRKGGVSARTILFDGQVAGNILCFERGGETLIGYWLGREFWGKGIATRALTQFLSIVKHRPLHARVAKHNTRSIRVLEKCGFVHCGEGSITDLAEPVEEFVFRLSGDSPAT